MVPFRGTRPALLGLFPARMVSLLRADHAGIQPERAEAAEESGVLNFNATIHHYFQTRVARALRGLFVNHAKLHPDDLRADFNRFLDDSGHCGGFAENVHDVHRTGYLKKCRIGLEVQHFLLTRIHRNHVEAFLPQINRREMAGAEWIGRKAHHGNPLIAFEYPDTIRNSGCKPALVHWRVAAYAVGHYALLARLSA